MKTEKVTTYYHGTCSLRADLMVTEGFAFDPLFLTTNRESAEHYAQARTANDLRDSDRELTPALIVIDVPESEIEVDEYNLDGEPDQYKLRKPNRFHAEAFVEDVDGEWPQSELEMLRLSAFCIGMMKYEDDRTVTPVGAQIGFTP